MPSPSDWTALRMKFIKGATSAQTVKVDDPTGKDGREWWQVDLVNPTDSNMMFVVAIAQHKSKKVFDVTFQWHQTALILEGEMVVQDRDTMNVYRARPGDVFYWAPGLRVRMGGEFKAYAVRSPAVQRWLKTPDGKKRRFNLFELEDEITYPATPPEEIRQELIEEGRQKAPFPEPGSLIKFLKGALQAETVEVADKTQMPMDRWRQVDLVKARDSDIMMVVGIAEHPINTMNEHVGYFYYHQAALIIEGEMVNYDMNTGGVYRAQVGDLFYWGPGHRLRIGGQFKAFFVKTPIPFRWVNTDRGKVVLDMMELENEIRYQGSPPDEMPSGLIEHA